MKKITLIIPILLSCVTVDAMQQPAKKYSEAASKKLMEILKKDYQHSPDQDLNEVISALNEGADPNYTEQHTLPHYEGYRTRSGYILMDVDEGDTICTFRSGQTVITTPLNEAIRLGNKDIISILLKAGANPDLRIIRNESNINVGNYQLKTAREIAQNKGIQLIIIPIKKLK